MLTTRERFSYTAADIF